MTVPDSFSSAVLFFALVAPGLLFEVGLARRLNYLRRSLADRLLRFVAWSLLLDALLLPLIVVVASQVPRDVDVIGGGDLVLLWVFAVFLTVGPFLLGSRIAQSGSRVRHWFLGRDPAPLAWHELWGGLPRDRDTYLRVRLREGGTWIAGRWAYSSDEPEDLLLAPRVECDPVTGAIAVDPETGYPQVVQWNALLRASDLDRIEVQPTNGG